MILAPKMPVRSRNYSSVRRRRPVGTERMRELYTQAMTNSARWRHQYYRRRNGRSYISRRPRSLWTRPWKRF